MTSPSLPPVEHLARLARLRIEPAEATRLGAQLEHILAHFQTLQDIDTEGVEASPYAVRLSRVVRPDGPVEGGVELPRGAALVRDHAPAADGDQYRVPPILEG